MTRTATFLHTMVRITDPEKSRTLYEALGFEFASEMDIVRDGQLRRRTTSSRPTSNRYSS